MKRSIALALALACAACASVPDDARRELTPTGKLRVGIGVGASPSAFWATKDPATGRPRGVTVKNTKLVSFRTVDEVVAKMKAGEIDAIALGRESLRGLAPQLPGARILDGHFHATGTSVAVPKGKRAAQAWVTRFIEEGKTDGTVRRALDGAGFSDLAVAPLEQRK